MMSRGIAIEITPLSAHHSARVDVRLAVSGETHAVARMFFELWPDGALDEHRAAADLILAGTPPSTLPLVVFVAEAQGKVIGFVEVGLRSHADGCDTRHPVAFIEGWFVEPEHRGKGVGRALMRAAEAWARSQGCREMASDTWMDNEPSLRAHEALGFEVVDRCVHFKKALPMKTNRSTETVRRVPPKTVHEEVDPRVVKLLAALRADPDLAPVTDAFEKAKRQPGRKFGSNGLTVNGKLFALFTQGTLVIKLQKDRVAELVASNAGKPFNPGHGRLMKEWLTVTSPAASWVELAKEAFAFVRGAPGPRRGGEGSSRGGAK